MNDRGEDVGATPGWGPTDDLLRGGSRPGLADRLERWAADARVDEAALRRSRERWLRDVAGQEATLVGTLLDLAERHAAVSVRTASGRNHHGSIEALGVDFVCLRPPTGAVVLIATRALALVRTAGDAMPAGSDRAVRTDLRLADLLRELAADRERVLLVLADGSEPVVGQLRAAGEDVLTLRTDGEPSSTVYVSSAAVSEVSLG